MAAPRSPEIFNSPEKIVVRQTGDRIIAASIQAGIICRNNLHVLIPKVEISINVFLGVLNSRLIDFIYTTINPEKGEALAEVKKVHIEQLPIKLGNDTQQRELDQLVSQITKEKKQDPSFDTQKIDLKIDVLVYKIYGLSFLEAKIIDPNLNQSVYS